MHSNDYPFGDALLDTDLYKLTMQQAILRLYPDVPVEYRFIHRSTDPALIELVSSMTPAIRQMLAKFMDYRVSLDGIAFLRAKCPYLTSQYLDYLSDYCFNPDEVACTTIGGKLDIRIKGPWARTVLWEVPLMAAISELFFQSVDTDWNFTGFDTRSKVKLKALAAMRFNASCGCADFGTRRRRSFEAQDRFLQLAANEDPSSLSPIGTSNVLFAMKHGLPVVGTMAHEFIQGVSAIRGLQHANRGAMDDWAYVYRGQLGVVLTDTYGTDAFLQDFDGFYARLYDGVRQDSGDPIGFARKMIQHYTQLGVNPLNKYIVFSDGLDIKLATKIRNFCIGKIGCKICIGTHLTNDFLRSRSKEQSKPLNMVIKLWRCADIPVAKLSDDAGKESGEPKAIQLAKDTFGRKQ